MRVYWERIGVLSPICRLVGQGFNDCEIAKKLNLTETKVRDCISWMLQSFRFPDRRELVWEAFRGAGQVRPLSSSIRDGYGKEFRC